ncbi:MAG: AIM24 family protein [Acidobacteriota bacterium]
MPEQRKPATSEELDPSIFNEEWLDFCRRYALLSSAKKRAEIERLTLDQRAHFKAVWESRAWNSTSTSELFQIVSSRQAEDGTRVDLLEFPKLEGSADLRTAKELFYASQRGVRLKTIRISLLDSNVRVEPGALYYMRGRLELKASTGGGVLKGLSRKLLSGETFFVNEIHGTGEVYIEPTFGHFILHYVDGSEGALIVDRGLFYAGTSGLNISSVRQKNISAALFGGEGLYQTKIEGKGIAVFYSPVPEAEVDKVALAGEKLWVDGNFALARTEHISFRAEKSSKGLLSSAVSGEGLLQTFEGTGSVWIAPTQGVYEKLVQQGGAEALARPPGSLATKTM